MATVCRPQVLRLNALRSSRSPETPPRHKLLSLPKLPKPGLSRSIITRVAPPKRDPEQSSSGSGPSWPSRSQLKALMSKLAGSWRSIQPLRLMFQAAALFMLMRLWPLDGRPTTGQSERTAVNVPYSQFIRNIKQDEVHSVDMDALSITYTLRPNSKLLKQRIDNNQPSQVTLITTRPSDYSMPYDIMEKHGVQFSSVDRRNNKISLLIWALYIGILLSAINRLPLKMPVTRGAGRKHRGSSTSSPITFADVAGVDDAKEELQEIVDYLRSPERFVKLGARPPSGVLLVGPPGTGKTLLAKAVAGEADVPFFSISASEFVELYVGMGAMRVRELFANARKEAPAIVFIDEIDAVAKGRDSRLRSVGNDEREQTLNQLLTELDGFDTDQENSVICLAATNRADVLDSALLRPGRFDRRVAVERPDRVGREQILKVHLKRRSLPLGADVAPSSLAAATTGFTGADLANLVNEAALLAGRRGRSEVGKADFDDAVLRAVAGIEKKRNLMGSMEKDVVAKHEAGHAIVSTCITQLLPGSPPVEKLSIIPRSGGSLGFTYIPPTSEDRALMFDSEIRGNLAMLMGGRAAEQLTCPATSTGASDDIRRATDLAYKAVADYGLSSTIGPVNVAALAAGGSQQGALLMKDSGNLGQAVEEEVRALLEGALTVAMDVLVENRSIHEGLAGVLAKDERLEGEPLHAWLQHVKPTESLRQYVLQAKIPLPAGGAVQPQLQQHGQQLVAAAQATAVRS